VGTKIQENPTLREYERIIGQIKEVISARVVANDHGAIEEIHVLAGSGRGPKQIVRDIESAFMAQFGVSVDHKKISVAQVQDDLAAGGQPRIKLVSVNLTTTGTKAEARVQLEFEETACEGTAIGVASGGNRLRLVAAACLQAVEQYFKGECVFAVEEIRVVSIANREAVLVAVALVTPTGEELFIGSSVIRDDDREAVARATLDAINRQFAVWVKKAS